MSTATFIDHGDAEKDLEAHLLGLADDLTPAETVLLDVDAELERQDALWGDQSHLPNGTAEHFRAVADAMREHANAQDKKGELTFADILSEEFYEALSEEDEDALETELIQVAAVASQWVKAIRTRRERRAA